jgi:hypothetical protein
MLDVLKVFDTLPVVGFCSAGLEAAAQGQAGCLTPQSTPFSFVDYQPPHGSFPQHLKQTL